MLIKLWFKVFLLIFIGIGVLQFVDQPVFVNYILLAAAIICA